MKRPYTPPSATPIPWPRLRLERVCAALEGTTPTPPDCGPHDHPILFVDDKEESASGAFVLAMLESWSDIELACALRLPIAPQLLAEHLTRREH